MLLLISSVYLAGFASIIFRHLESISYKIVLQTNLTVPTYQSNTPLHRYIYNELEAPHTYDSISVSHKSIGRNVNAMCMFQAEPSQRIPNIRLVIQKYIVDFVNKKAIVRHTIPFSCIVLDEFRDGNGVVDTVLNMIGDSDSLIPLWYSFTLKNRTNQLDTSLFVSTDLFLGTKLGFTSITMLGPSQIISINLSTYEITSTHVINSIQSPSPQFDDITHTLYNDNNNEKDNNNNNNNNNNKHKTYSLRNGAFRDLSLAKLHRIIGNLINY